MTKRATVYLNPAIHRAIKLKAVQTDATISDLVNEALRLSLKRAGDRAGAEVVRREDGPVFSVGRCRVRRARDVRHRVRLSEAKESKVSGRGSYNMAPGSPTIW